MDRAFSTFALKQFNEEQRTFSGLATSPAPDRVLDIIEPLGVKYQNPTVLLRAHDHTLPIGSVVFDRPTKTGVGFTARIPKIEEPGLLKDRVDMAWGEVKHGLIKAVSIGFRPLDTPEPLQTGGLRYPKVEIFELSTVAVPAQELATIDQVKAIDAAVRRGEVASAGMIESGPLAQMMLARGKAALDAEEKDLQAGEKFKELGAAGYWALLIQCSSREMLEFLADRIEGLERRFDEQGRAYKGIWKPGFYQAGSFVTHAGSMWHADNATDFKPGEGGGWTLAVKKGADAK
jgi:hypothetical protein